MTWKQMFTSSIGKKLVMAFTGVFLILFLIVHVGLNACIWANDKGEMFNKAAHFMGSMVVPRILEIGLFAGFLLHIMQGYMLAATNRSKRETSYAINYGNKGSKWYSRSMGLLGTIILLFLIVHINHFWMPSRLGGIGNIENLNRIMYSGVEYHDLYGEMREEFSEWWVVVVYTLGCISLAYHLAHGFQSAAKTLGVHNKRYQKMLCFVGYSFAIMVPLAFIMMPISFYFGWIK